jgi:hypothetical protein
MCAHARAKLRLKGGDDKQAPTVGRGAMAYCIWSVCYKLLNFIK